MSAQSTDGTVFTNEDASYSFVCPYNWSVVRDDRFYPDQLNIVATDQLAAFYEAQSIKDVALKEKTLWDASIITIETGKGEGTLTDTMKSYIGNKYIKTEENSEFTTIEGQDGLIYDGYNGIYNIRVAIVARPRNEGVLYISTIYTTSQSELVTKVMLGYIISDIKFTK